MKYHLWVLGCAQNYADAERITSVLESLGYQKAASEKEADLICVVACSVRQSAIDRIFGKSKVWKRLKPKPLLLLSGCILLKDKPQMRSIFDIFFEIKDLAKLPKLLKKKEAVISLSKDYLEILPKRKSNFQALIPIMTGCNNFCSYCAVPYTRGREVSRKAKDIVSEIISLVKNGYKEITLLGQNVNSYQNKNGSKTIDFPDLLKLINNIPGNFWIRFISNHPKDVSDKLIKTMKECRKVTPYINLPLQSGDDKILKKMNRHYTVKKYLSIVKKLQEKIPNITISADIIVGFPTETKQQFQNTAKIMKETELDMAYISQYSPRPGSKAEKLKDDVPKTEKKRRDKILTEVLAKTALEQNKKLLKKEVEVLPEGYKNEFLFGRTKNYKNIKFKGNKNLVGQFVKVKVTNCTPWALEGELV